MQDRRLPAAADPGPALALLAFGVPLIVLGGVLAWNQAATMRGTVTVDGRVAAFSAVLGYDRGGRVVPSRTVHAPILSFSMPDGSAMRVISRDYVNPPCCTVGDDVRLRFRPEAPEQVRIVTLRDDWLWPGLSALVGALLTAAGLIVLRSNLRVRARLANGGR